MRWLISQTNRISISQMEKASNRCQFTIFHIHAAVLFTNAHQTLLFFSILRHERWQQTHKHYRRQISYCWIFILCYIFHYNTYCLLIFIIYEFIILYCICNIINCTKLLYFIIIFIIDININYYQYYIYCFILIHINININLTLL